MGGTRRSDDDGPLSPVELFVASMAADLGLGSRSVDVRRRAILLRLARWAVAQGMGLDREVVLDPVTVERFCSTALADSTSRATLRADLRWAGPQLTRAAPWEPRAEAMAVRKVAPPYTPAEIEILRTDAAQQPSATRRRGARALLALGLGAGLDGRWVTRIGPNEVRRGEGFVTVAVPEPAARLVVVRAEWESEILELAATAGAGVLIGRKSQAKSRVADMARRLRRPTGHPRLSPPRLRSTWLVALLTDGVPVQVICAAAGLSGITTLSDLIPDLPPVDPDKQIRLLRGRP